MVKMAPLGSVFWMMCYMVLGFQKKYPKKLLERAMPLARKTVSPKDADKVMVHGGVEGKETSRVLFLTFLMWSIEGLLQDWKRCLMKVFISKTR